MPIKGLSDRGLAFPEIGHIRKGAPKGEKTIGQDLKYFRVEFDANDLAAQDAFLKAYPGGKPTRLNVVLPFPDIDRVWDTWLEAYTAGRLVARTDGDTFQYLVDTDTGDILVRNGLNVITNEPMPYKEKQPVGKDYKGKNVYCKAVGRMKVVLPELQRLAFMTVLTGSKHDIINLSNQLRAIEALCLQMGKPGIGGVPLILCRRPVQISCPEIDPQTYKPTGKRVRREKWLLSIEADPEFVKRALMVTKFLALPGNGLALPAPLEQIEDLFMAEDDQDEDETPPDENQEVPLEELPMDDPPIEVQAKAAVRDRTPEEVKKWIMGRVKDIEQLAKAGREIPVTPNERKLLASVLGNTLRVDTDRYALCRWLVGEASTMKMTAIQVRALLEWQSVSSFEEMPPDYVIQETIACLAAANGAAGQKKLI